MLLSHHRAGSGEPLLLVHGIGSHWQVWEPVLERLAREREVIAVDLPGFGGSPVLSGEEPTVAALATAVAGWARDELGVPDAHVAGNSLGGGIAFELAKAGFARSVCGLSPIGFATAREAGYARSMLKLSHALARRLDRHADLVMATRAGRTVATAHLLARPWNLPADRAAASVRNLADSPGFTPTLGPATRYRFTASDRITVPVTIAWGQLDALLPPWQARRARAALPAARHVTLHRCGHVPTWDDPGQVARVLLEASSA